MWLEDLATLDRVAEAYIAHSQKLGYWAYSPQKVEFHQAGEGGYRDRLKGYRAGLSYFLNNRNAITAAFLNINPCATDPIFALIEAHRAAEIAFGDVVMEEARVEEALYAKGVAVSDHGKHPLMKAHKRKWERMEGTASKALRKLCNTKPVTFEGHAALMTYLLPIMEDGADPGTFADGRTDNLFRNLVSSINSLVFAGQRATEPTARRQRSGQFTEPVQY
jgi:hypothetical protein